MHEFAKDLYRIGREFKGSELSGWITLTASILIIMMASLKVLAKVWGVLAVMACWLIGSRPEEKEDDFPEGA